MKDPADISLGAEPKPAADARRAQQHVPDARAFGELALELERALAERDEAVARERAAREDAEAARAALERERGRLLHEVRHRAAELEGALDAAAEGLVINGPDGALVLMNGAARRLLGFTPEELDLDWRERFERCHPLDAQGREVPGERHPVARALAGETLRGELMRLTRPGRPHLWLSVNAAPIRDEEGRVLGAVTTLTDVTRERERDEQREDLLRGVSHDLRTPLTTVLLHAQRLAKHADADVRRRADAIITAGRRMDALIRDLVESARLEAGQIRLSPRPLAVGPLVEELLARSPALGLGRVRLTADAQAVAVADPERIERVVANLLSNALKYSPADSPVDVRVARTGSEVEISITNQGDGIPAEELPRLFGRYWRSRRADGVEGTGLGLYITRLLVEAHGGHVRAESALGTGSTFRFTLPAAARG